MDFIQNLMNDDSIKVLCVVIVMDLVFGILRGIKERKLNSTIGIDGMIRKTRNVNNNIFLKFN